jgi:hypothetical protein
MMGLTISPPVAMVRNISAKILLVVSLRFVSRGRTKDLLNIDDSRLIR